MRLLAFLACASAPPGEVTIYARDAGGYTIAPREVPALEDPRRVSGELGTVRHGGRFAKGDEGPYTGGRALDVRYVVQDGVGVPLDQEGLLLWSFYAHLASARDALTERGLDVSPIFPVDIAWNPAVSPLIELSPADNAAYAIGSNLFLLLPDGDDREVPLLANEGVVVHELGHAVFHLLTRGDPTASPLVADASTEAGMWQASMHEAFADALATLLLDEPRFMDPSIDMPARWVDANAVLTDALLPSAGSGDATAALLYDPYPLGSVFASAVWDVRVDLDDRDRALALLFRAVEAWAPRGGSDLDGARFLAAWVEAADEEERAYVCRAIHFRMDGVLTAEGCP
ncbi:MAG: hypothetical protein ACK4YP_04875 [Myxococcota bacterium]